MKFFTLFSVLMLTVSLQAKDILLTSPGGNVKVTIQTGKQLTYSVEYNGVQVVTPSAVSMTLQNGTVLGQNVNPSVSRKKVSQVLTPVAYRKAQIDNNYNEVVLKCKGYSVEFRAFDAGCAYRFNLTQGNKEIIVQNELSEFNFSQDYTSYYAYSNKPEGSSIDLQFSCSFENRYNHTPLSQISQQKIMFLPVMVELPQNIKMCITEVNQFDYPGMFLQNFDAKTALTSIFAPYPKDMHQAGHNNLQLLVDSREDYIAKINGNRTMPWRTIALSCEDKDMTNSDLVYCLADDCQLDDTSWIKPGKVAWDWWNDWNLQGVDFRAGINNETYHYYIDFASQHGIEYVILDEGWAVTGAADMMNIIPEIDLKDIIAYGAKKNVGIILWGGFQAMDKDMESICKHYAEMGVKGFKVDFMDRDDQLAVNFYNRMAKVAAKYKLMVDFHGAFKPSGMNRTYPNVINYEGVAGLETMKWDGAEVDQVTYDVTLPFIRQVAGPMDYTQGAMINMNRKNYRAINSEPMSMGTRCHQLAEYIIFESPLNMMCDSPTNYEKEPAYTKFLAQIPVTWDETCTLDGRVAEYVLTARRKGNDWYIGGLNNWDIRTLTIDLSFLGNADDYVIEAYIDGVNADRKGSDYKYIKYLKPTNGKLNIKMQPGGGFVVKATKK